MAPVRPARRRAWGAAGGGCGAATTTQGRPGGRRPDGFAMPGRVSRGQPLTPPTTDGRHGGDDRGRRAEASQGVVAPRDRRVGRLSCASLGTGAGHANQPARRGSLRSKDRVRVLRGPGTGPYDRPVRILLVEDERGIADFVERALRGQGHEVEVATDGPDGRAPRARRRPGPRHPRRDASRPQRDRGPARHPARQAGAAGHHAHRARRRSPTRSAGSTRARRTTSPSRSRSRSCSRACARTSGRRRRSPRPGSPPRGSRWTSCAGR